MSDQVKSVVASIIVAAVVGWGSVQIALQNQLSDGKAIFDNIALRYFEALFAVYNAPGEEPGLPTPNEQHWDAYRATLGDLQEDIRSLRTNPLYDRIQGDTQDLAILQNRLVRETHSKRNAADATTEALMCKLFAPPADSIGFRRAESDDGGTSEIYEFARERSPLPQPSPGPAEGM